ncbi:uncharacterized protein LOC143916623 isoform X2 [Arctopsyche grandis]|uniref:uncharacterized protein LOC143916623 isoform X2 n=1 Tax=Arctopsyche grandis TaxID=121162 RepID=UPI00406D9274
MALVMLPCELPWWTSVQRHLKHLLLASSTTKFIDGMLKIHDMCNISLDPDEDEKDPNLFDGLYDFLENDLTNEERTHFMEHTLPSIVRRALHLKHWKPATGLVFSLQQQPDLTELSYDFVSSLLAHAFFSTYPKRTLKTHPTLQDFNFTYFFKNLHSPFQKVKMKSILHYFDWIETNKNEGTLKISRQIMNSKQWLTIEDWLECSLPLCRIQIKHEGRMEKNIVEGVEVCFANSRLGGDVLSKGSSQESIMLCMMPDILAILLSIEALEDNEIIAIEGARRFARITDTKQKWRLEILPNPQQVSLCCIDPENYSILPASQFEEDNILRELNKCLLGFQQKPLKPPEVHLRNPDRRLSPIGESFSHTPPEVEATVIVKQTSASTLTSFSSRSPSPDAYCAATINLNDPSVEIWRSKCRLAPETNTLNNRRGRFIVLGSSGECLPVKRPIVELCDSLYSSCNSSFDEYHSANTSFDDGSVDEGQEVRQYSLELNTAERRASFAQRLKDALRREMENSLTDSMSTDSSYAVGISVTGSGLQDPDIRLNRGGSGGFVLTEDSLDEDFLKNSLQQEQEWISKFRSRKNPGLIRRDTNDSSKYSFSTEYSSDLEEVYEQFSHWLEDPIFEKDSIKRRGRELDSRDLAVVRFASSLLKRTLSESFAGVPMTEGCAPMDRKTINKSKLMTSVRSLSLELARHKHKLAAQLLSQLANKTTGAGRIKPIVTGNWGCGSSKRANAQMKLIIQWLAASVAGTPTLLYYTSGNSELFKLDTLIRVLVDRKWTVGQLTVATLRFAQQTLNEPHVIHESNTLFDELIGIEKYIEDQ